MTTLPNAGTDSLLKQYKFICQYLAYGYWHPLERNMHFRVDVTLYMPLVEHYPMITTFGF